jgi:hypothetical protein
MGMFRHLGRTLAAPAILTVLGAALAPASAAAPSEQAQIDALRALVATLTQELGYLRDRQAILDCLKRYTRGADRHDVELIKSAFWPDASISYGKPISVEEFAKWGNSLHAAKYVQNQHHITGQTVDIQGNIAHVESYVIYFLLSGEKTTGTNTIGSGRYIEQYEKRNGEWRIKIREYIPDVLFEGTTPIDMCPPELGCLGKRDHSDISYMRPLKPMTDRPKQPGSMPDKKK